MESKKILDPLNHWVDDYLPDAEGKKGNTIKSYKATWRLMFKYFQLENIKAADVTYKMLTYDRIMAFFHGWRRSETARFPPVTTDYQHCQSSPITL